MIQKTKLEGGTKFLKGISTGQLQEYHRKEKDPKARDRLTACIQYRLGYTIREVALNMNRCHSIIRDWLLRIRDGGLDNRYDVRREGRACWLNAKQRRQLIADLKESPQEFGFETALWTSKIVKRHIQDRFGVDYSIRGVQDLLPRIGMSWKKARPKHPRSAPESARKAFKKKLGGRRADTPRRDTPSS